jgi:hypothetical protein
MEQLNFFMGVFSRTFGGELTTQLFFGVSQSKIPIKEGIRRLFVAQLLCLPDQFMSPLP